MESSTWIRYPSTGCACGCNDGPVSDLARDTEKQVLVLPDGPIVTLPAIPGWNMPTDNSGDWVRGG
jgi:hypothetical protein